MSAEMKRNQSLNFDRSRGAMELLVRLFTLTRTITARRYRSGQLPEYRLRNITRLSRMEMRVYLKPCVVPDARNGPFSPPLKSKPTRARALVRRELLRQYFSSLSLSHRLARRQARLRHVTFVRRLSRSNDLT